MSDRVKAAFTVGVDTKGWEDSPGIIAGVPTAGLGAAALAAGGATELATRKLDLLEPGILDKAKQFKELPEMKGPAQDFLARYTDLGSAITRGPVLRDLEGNPWSGRKLVENIRSGDIGKVLSSAGVVQDFDADSRRHYQEFEKGPAAATREMYRETFNDPVGQFKGDVLGRRYRAAREILDRGEAPTAEAMAAAFADDPFMSRFERQLAESNPEAYQRVFDVMREGGDPSGLQNELVDPLIGQGDPLRGRVDEVLRGAGLTDEAFAELDGVQRRSLLRQMYSGTPVADWAAQRMGPIYRGNIEGYQRIIDPIVKGEAVRKGVQRGGRGLMGLGLLGLGAGALGIGHGVNELGDFQGIKIGSLQTLQSAGLVDFFKEAGEGGTEIHAASTMIAIYPPATVADKIKPYAAVDQADTLHVTLVYLGHKTESEALRAASVIEDCCRECSSLELKVNGAGAFHNDDASVRQLLIGGVGLSELRAKIFEALVDEGLTSAAEQNHGFIPHMTLEYHGDKVLPEGWDEVGKLNLSWNCGEVRVVRGDKLVARVPLGAPANHDFAPRVTGDERLRVDVKVKNDDGKVLAGNWPDNPDKKFLPGGGVEANETLEQAGEREVAEETGWKVKDVKKSDEPDTIIPGESRTVWLEAKVTGEKDDPRKGDDAGKFLRNVKFVDEDDVEKVAVTLQQLRKGTDALKQRVPIYRRGLQATETGGVTLRRTGDDLLGPVGPAAMKPTDPEGLDAMLDEGLRHVDEVPSWMDHVPPQRRPSTQALSQARRDALYAMVREMNSGTRGFPQRPQIFMGKREPVKFIQDAMEDDRLNRLVPQMSPAGREAFNRSVWLHEGAELGKQFGGRGFASHLSTRPMLQDLNIAATLEGPGEEAANALRLMREPEIEAIEAVVPGAERLGLGQNRLSRHAQKRLQEAYERNLAQTSREAKTPQWEMIQGAVPRAKVAGDWDDPVDILEAMEIDPTLPAIDRNAARARRLKQLEFLTGQMDWNDPARRPMSREMHDKTMRAFERKNEIRAEADALGRPLETTENSLPDIYSESYPENIELWRKQLNSGEEARFHRYGRPTVYERAVGRADVRSEIRDHMRQRLMNDETYQAELRHRQVAEALAHLSAQETLPETFPQGLRDQATSWADDLGMGDLIRKALTKKGSAEKVAGSRLREALRMVPVEDDPDAYRWMLGDRRVGFVDLYPGTNRIARAGGVPVNMRNMGLGKKMYGDLLRERGELQSDYGVSEAASRVWQGMPGRGIEMQMNPEAVENVIEGRRVAWLIPHDRDASVFEATHPLQKQSSARKERDIELWEQWKRTKSQQDLTALMKQMDGAIQSEVNRWSGAIARPVLEAKAKKLALEAFETYDPNMGAALNTHLTNRLKKLSRQVYTHQDAVRLPEYKKLKVHSYVRGYNELMGEHGREPTNAELQDHLAWSPKMVSDVQRGMMPELVESADVGGGLFERQSVWGSDSEDGLVDMFYFDLDPTDKLIFEHSTGYSGKKVLSNPQLMKKTGLTQGQLSYRKRKIIDRLKELQG